MQEVEVVVPIQIPLEPEVLDEVVMVMLEYDLLELTDYEEGVDEEVTLTLEANDETEW